jgi:hypothetical protein
MRNIDLQALLAQYPPDLIVKTDEEEYGSLAILSIEKRKDIPYGFDIRTLGLLKNSYEVDLAKKYNKKVKEERYGDEFPDVIVIKRVRDRS